VEDLRGALEIGDKLLDGLFLVPLVPIPPPFFIPPLMLSVIRGRFLFKPSFPPAPLTGFLSTWPRHKGQYEHGSACDPLFFSPPGFHLLTSQEWLCGAPYDGWCFPFFYTQCTFLPSAPAVNILSGTGPHPQNLVQSFSTTVTPFFPQFMERSGEDPQFEPH